MWGLPSARSCAALDHQQQKTPMPLLPLLLKVSKTRTHLLFANGTIQNSCSSSRF
jgi:hypothetical protein